MAHSNTVSYLLSPLFQELLRQGKVWEPSGGARHIVLQLWQLVCFCAVAHSILQYAIVGDDKSLLTASMKEVTKKRQ